MLEILHPARRRFLDGRNDVAAAFSLKRLRSAYTGPLVRVRRSGDNAEADFAHGQRDVDGGELLGFAGAGTAFVSRWYDQGGRARDLVQATAGAQPRMILAANGLPALLFDSDRMDTAPFGLAQPWSFTIVYRIVAASGTFVVFDGTSGTDVGELYGGTGTDTALLYAGASLGAGGGTAAALPNGRRGAVGGVFAGASSLGEIDAASVLSLTGNPGAGNPGGLRLGANGGGSFPANMEVQEFVAFNTAHGPQAVRQDNAARRRAWRF